MSVLTKYFSVQHSYMMLVVLLLEQIASSHLQHEIPDPQVALVYKHFVRAGHITHGEFSLAET